MTMPEIPAEARVDSLEDLSRVYIGKHLVYFAAWFDLTHPMGRYAFACYMVEVCRTIHRESLQAAFATRDLDLMELHRCNVEWAVDLVRAWKKWGGVA